MCLCICTELPIMISTMHNSMLITEKISHSIRKAISENCKNEIIKSCFYGNLSAASAESILGESSGKFIVWRSGQCLYTLSIKDADSNTHHIVIQILRGSFWALNLSFSSLSEAVESIVELFEDCSPLLNTSDASLSSIEEDLLREEGNDLCMVKLPFMGSEEKNELKVLSGDIVREIQPVSQEYVVAESLSTGTVGLVGLYHLQPITSSCSSIASNPSELSYCYTEEETPVTGDLLKKGPGSFLVQQNIVDSMYSLLVNTGGWIRKYQIEVTKDGFVFEGYAFFCIEDIIQRYSSHPLNGEICLRNAVVKIFDEPSLSHMTSFSSTYFEDCFHNKEFVVDTVPVIVKFFHEKSWRKCNMWLIEYKSTYQIVLSDNDNQQDYEKYCGLTRCVFPLETCQLYMVHHSVLNRQGCIYLIDEKTGNRSGYISFEPQHTYLAWISLIRSRCPIPSSLSLDDIHEYFFVAPDLVMFSVTLKKYSSQMLSRKMGYAATVMLDEVRVHSTKYLKPMTKNGQKMVIFDSDFVVFCSAKDTNAFFVEIRAKESDPNSFKPDIRQLRYSTQCIPIRGNLKDLALKISGLSLSVNRVVLPVFAADQYSPLINALQMKDFVLCNWVYKHAPPPLRKQFVLSLWICLLSHPQTLNDFIESLLHVSMMQEDRAFPFRGDTFCTSMLAAGLRFAVSSQFEADLLNNVGSVFQKRTVTPDDITVISHQVVSCAYQAAAQRILRLVGSVARNYFPDDLCVTMRILVSIFVLRFASPILASLQAGNANSIAKMVQSAANNACRESFEEENNSDAASVFRDLLTDFAFSEPMPLIGVAMESSADNFAVIAYCLSILVYNENLTCPLALSFSVTKLLEQYKTG